MKSKDYKGGGLTLEEDLKSSDFLHLFENENGSHENMFLSLTIIYFVFLTLYALYQFSDYIKIFLKGLPQNYALQKKKMI